VVLVDVGKALAKLTEALGDGKRVARSVEICLWLYFRLYLVVMVTCVRMHRIANSWVTARLTTCETRGASIWGRSSERPVWPYHHDHVHNLEYSVPYLARKIAGVRVELCL